MKILCKQIYTTLVGYIGGIWLAILSIDFILCFANELKHVGQGNYCFLHAAMFVFFVLPRKVYLLAPWALLIGGIVALHSLQKNSELIIMQLAGVSRRRLIGYFLNVGVVIALIVFMIGEFVTLRSEGFAQNFKYTLLQNPQGFFQDNNYWLKEKDFFWHVRNKKSVNLWENITRYQLKDNKIVAMQYAQTAYKQKDGWQLKHVTQIQLFPEVKKSLIDNLWVAASIDHDTLKMFNKNPERLTLSYLWQASKLNSNNLAYQQAFWRKIMHPFYMLIMLMLSLPLAYASMRDYSFVNKSLAILLIGLSFNLTNMILMPLINVLQLPAMLSVLLPLVMFSMIIFKMLPVAV